MRRRTLPSLYPGAVRLEPVAGALAAALVLAGGGSAASGPSFAFGRTGGNIQPYEVEISPTGRITASGAITLKSVGTRLPRTTLAHLLGIASRQRFFALPRRLTCAGSLPDFASSFVRVSTTTRTRTVLVRGDCSPRFGAVLLALERAAGVPVASR